MDTTNIRWAQTPTTTQVLYIRSRRSINHNVQSSRGHVWICPPASGLSASTQPEPEWTTPQQTDTCPSCGIKMKTNSFMEMLSRCTSNHFYILRVFTASVLANLTHFTKLLAGMLPFTAIFTNPERTEPITMGQGGGFTRVMDSQDSTKNQNRF